jgi:hypothetical protein
MPAPAEKGANGAGKTRDFDQTFGARLVGNNSSLPMSSIFSQALFSMQI